MFNTNTYVNGGIFSFTFLFNWSADGYSDRKTYWLSIMALYHLSYIKKKTEGEKKANKNDAQFFFILIY